MSVMKGDHPDRVISGTLGGMGWLRPGSFEQAAFERMGGRQRGRTPAACVHGIARLAVPEEEVTKIKAPVEISLRIKGINGRVTTADIDGSLDVSGINGGADFGSATHSVDVSGMNGSFSLGLKQLTERGARISGVNGNVQLKLMSGLNAELNARGMNGRVVSDIPDVTIDKEDTWSRYSARIGSGGPPIDISGINGNVRLTRPGSASTTSAANQK